jgi:SOS-response transcriptional repressor LexA
VIKHDNKIELRPVNPNYPPQTFKNDGDVTIIGVVKELRRKVL